MAAELRITEASDLNRINEIIHDYWFDLGDVTFNEATSTLEIRFSRPPVESEVAASGWSLLRRVDVPYVESLLRIHHVLHWTLEDSQRVSLYDFNELRFDQGTRRIEVTTGVPLDLSADVETLELSVLVTDNVVKTEKRFAFLA